jgi:hypothetical protein
MNISSHVLFKLYLTLQLQDSKLKYEDILQSERFVLKYAISLKFFCHHELRTGD